ncbi:MAG: hypothetical protein M1825_004087 [Sarcosagium campestre]|nr:MAG: hypothetical protein M1825_004087 [Sarcosagium campestre]
MSPASNEAPKAPTLTGGCLCGGVRYSVDFSGDGQWPPNTGLCNCTRCRKASGALVSHTIEFSVKQISWTPAHDDANASYREYQSSENCRRGFCSVCGGTLSFIYDGTPDLLHIWTGSLDEKWVIGEDQSGGFVEELCIPRDGILFAGQAVRGVTDGLRGGPRYEALPGSKVLD